MRGGNLNLFLALYISTAETPCPPITCPTCLKGYKLVKVQDRTAAGCDIDCVCQILTEEEACQVIFALPVKCGVTYSSSQY